MSAIYLQTRPRACSQAAARHRTALADLSEAAQLVVETLRLWRRRMRERDELGRLDERMLQDIGITRAEALRISSQPFWRE